MVKSHAGLLPAGIANGKLVGGTTSDVAYRQAVARYWRPADNVASRNHLYRATVSF